MTGSDTDRKPNVSARQAHSVLRDHNTDVPWWMYVMTPVLGLAIIIVVVIAIYAQPSNTEATAARIDSTRISETGSFPFDPSTWTEGIALNPADAHELLVSSGGGKDEKYRVPSRLWYQDLASGEKTTAITLPCSGDECPYGEGTAYSFDSVGRVRNLWALVWDGRAFARDPRSLTATSVLASSQTHTSSGWGACGFTDNRVVTSDGSDKLTLRSGDDFSPTGVVAVTGTGFHDPRLNALGCDNATGHVWANIFDTNDLAEIDPVTGRTFGILDISWLHAKQREVNAHTDIANGVAVAPRQEGDRATTLLITGKNWETLYRVRVEDDPEHH